MARREEFSCWRAATLASAGAAEDSLSCRPLFSARAWSRSALACFSSVRADSRSPVSWMIRCRRAEGSSDAATGAGAGAGVSTLAGAGVSERVGAGGGAGFSAATGAGVGGADAGGAESLADFSPASLSFRYLMRYLTIVGSHSGFSFLSFSRRARAVSYFSRACEFWPPWLNLSPSLIIT